MKCLVCGTENKEGAKFCRKCGTDTNVELAWRPTWRWHLKVLGAVYIFLILSYFAISAFLSKIPEPYRMREVPHEVTPWLNPK